MDNARCGLYLSPRDIQYNDSLGMSCHPILCLSMFSVISNSTPDFSRNFKDRLVFQNYAVGAAAC